MRLMLMLTVVIGLGLATPCAADYVLLWTSPGLFPSSPHPAGAPVAASFFGDLNGDNRAELVSQPWGNPHVLEIRDAFTGAVEGEVNILIDAGGAVTGVGMQDVNFDGIPELLVSFVKSDGSGIKGVAVYGWGPAVAGAASASGETVNLAPAKPNPFRQGTVIDFALNAPGRVDLEVFDVAGRMVRKIEMGQLVAGPHQAEWNGDDQSSRRASAGTYFYVLKVDGAVVGSRKTVLLN